MRTTLMAMAAFSALQAGPSATAVPGQESVNPIPAVAPEPLEPDKVERRGKSLLKSDILEGIRRAVAEEDYSKARLLVIDAEAKLPGDSMIRFYKGMVDAKVGTVVPAPVSPPAIPPPASIPRLPAPVPAVAPVPAPASTGPAGLPGLDSVVAPAQPAAPGQPTQFLPALDSALPSLPAASDPGAAASPSFPTDPGIGAMPSLGSAFGTPAGGAPDAAPVRRVPTSPAGSSTPVPKPAVAAAPADPAPEATAKPPAAASPDSPAKARSPLKIALWSALAAVGVLGVVALVKRKGVKAGTDLSGERTANMEVPRTAGLATFDGGRPDELTDADADQGEVARGIADQMGAFDPAQAFSEAPPAFDMVLDENTQNTFVEEEEEHSHDRPTMVDAAEHAAQRAPVLPVPVPTLAAAAPAAKGIAPVSFSELGISFGDPVPVPVPPPIPSHALASPAPPVAVPSAPKLPPAGAPALPAASAASAPPAPALSADSINLDALFGSSSMLVLQPPAQSPAAPAAAIPFDIDKLVFEPSAASAATSAMPVRSPAAPAMPAYAPMAPPPAIAGLPSMADAGGMETVRLPAFSSMPDLEATVGPDHPLAAVNPPRVDEALGATRTQHAPSIRPVSAASAQTGTYDSGQPPAMKAAVSTDERSERMFREQCERATKATAEGNWKQAVHYLSIAAAIHPEDSDVLRRLKAARDEKRRSEAAPSV